MSGCAQAGAELLGGGVLGHGTRSDSPHGTAGTAHLGNQCMKPLRLELLRQALCVRLNRKHPELHYPASGRAGRLRPLVLHGLPLGHRVVLLSG